MNDSETNLADQVDALRRQNFVMMLALIVVSGTVATYLAYQARVVGKTVEGVRQQTAPVIQTYNQITPHINRQQIDTFLNELGVYAVAHPDFQPVLKKYGWNPPAAPVKK
jgi:hypothetical protein